MSDVVVSGRRERYGGWSFSVTVGDTPFNVQVDKDHWLALTRGSIEPEDLVKKSFDFLLRRETKESILRSFNLREISKYFSEYEKMMKL
ncbi:Uncharacterised protein [uncultured archaeon]|nr:Uncharacterised protein [uncultured archaeon]